MKFKYKVLITAGVTTLSNHFFTAEDACAFAANWFCNNDKTARITIVKMED